MPNKNNGPNVAWIAADEAFNLGLNESHSPDGPKASEPKQIHLCGERKCILIIVPRLRVYKGSAQVSQWFGPILRTPRSEAGECLGQDSELRTRLLYLDVMPSEVEKVA